jgi:hypothetical protein
MVLTSCSRNSECTTASPQENKIGTFIGCLFLVERVSGRYRFCLWLYRRCGDGFGGVRNRCPFAAYDAFGFANLCHVHTPFLSRLGDAVLSAVINDAVSLSVGPTVVQQEPHDVPIDPTQRDPAFLSVFSVDRGRDALSVPVYLCRGEDVAAGGHDGEFVRLYR